MPDEKKTPLDSALELALYAPLGLALTARDHLPDLIARGRQQVTSQVTLARMMGQFAVKEGEKDLRKRVEGLTETLGNLGILPEPHPPASSSAATVVTPTPGTVPTPPPEVEVDVPATAATATATANGSPASNGHANGKGNGKAAATAGAAEAPTTASAAPVRSRADLSIPGYDTLSASQVVQRLAGLSPEELEDVRDYESGTRGRRTILSKIAQLQSDPSA